MDNIKLLNLLDIISIHRRNIIRSLDTSDLRLPINTTQERVLMAILKFPDQNMKELSVHVGLEKSSLTRVIDSLIEEGLVTRNYDVQDRRKINCSLTKKGLTQAGKIDRLMIKHIDNYFSDISQNDKDKLINNLYNAVKILSKYSQ